ncbi:uncharacterized protein LOC9631792 [Selaginella moellendorffii]|nr:uncharacterized protein LOC9631792 [Selaginella moellendorffii]|eukprot:XP_002970595.2 uncharacterized protein LOC9631792 [Selaginella moellendorffii]
MRLLGSPMDVLALSQPFNLGAGFQGPWIHHSSTRRSPLLARFDASNLMLGSVSGRRSARPCASSDDNLSSEDSYGPYPWDSSWQNSDAVEWMQGDTITLFTSEGLVRIGGSRFARPVSSSRKKQRLRRFREEQYMDPKQELCLGAVFDIAATNGLDLGRRFCVFGFCRSVEMLSDVVEDTVLEQGGEVVIAAKLTSSDLHEKLKMTVAIPLLWGVPPGLENLNQAIRCGGGIVEKAYYSWTFF